MQFTVHFPAAYSGQPRQPTPQHGDHDFVVAMAGWMRCMEQHSTVSFLVGTWGQRRQIRQWRLAADFLLHQWLCTKISPVNGHFVKWLPWPSGAKSVMAKYPEIFVIYWSICLPSLVLLSLSAQFFEYLRCAAHYRQNGDCFMRPIRIALLFSKMQISPNDLNNNRIML